MAKSKKITQEDLKALFDKTKKRLNDLGKETGVWIKKGEVEISRLSKMGKLEIDTVNLTIKRDQLYKAIGKKVIELDLGKDIGDESLRELVEKAKGIVVESKKKKKEISSIGNKFMKTPKTVSKKK